MRFRKKWQFKVVSITEDIGVLNQMSLATAFGQRLDLSEEKNKQLQESICTYIQQTEGFMQLTLYKGHIHILHK